MNKADFIAYISTKLDYSKTETTRNVEAVLDAMQEVFQRQEVLTLPGFGTLGVKKRAARSGRNPRTGKAIQIPETLVPYVRLSSKIKALMAANPLSKSGKKANKE
jgi:DNA-binding protein HU-beta